MPTPNETAIKMAEQIYPHLQEAPRAFYNHHHEVEKLSLGAGFYLPQRVIKELETQTQNPDLNNPETVAQILVLCTFKVYQEETFDQNLFDKCLELKFDTPKQQQASTVVFLQSSELDCAETQEEDLGAEIELRA